ncbi:MAG: hypothetical protein WBG46_13360 [Nonlabens sp.]
MTENRPPIFSDRSLRVGTKIIAIYALFYVVTALVPLLFNPSRENELMPQNHYAPVYFNAAVHLIIFLAALLSVLKKRFSWFLVGISIVVILASRIFYRDISVLVWGWTS